MFKKDVDYKKVINDYINSEINKNKELYFTGKEGFNGISDNQDFYIEDDGIVIYFQVYDIAPYYVGIPKFKIDNNQFKKYLNI
ncbi:RsiV family protein [Romboutsia sp. Marseille-P6047]|nr:RsiV family protein [Romboutsia sp. Marseille-P6047]